MPPLSYQRSQVVIIPDSIQVVSSEGLRNIPSCLSPPLYTSMSNGISALTSGPPILLLEVGTALSQFLVVIMRGVPLYLESIIGITTVLLVYHIVSRSPLIKSSAISNVVDFNSVFLFYDLYWI